MDVLCPPTELAIFVLNVLGLVLNRDRRLGVVSPHLCLLLKLEIRVCACVRMSVCVCARLCVHVSACVRACVHDVTEFVVS